MPKITSIPPVTNSWTKNPSRATPLSRRRRAIWEGIRRDAMRHQLDEARTVLGPSEEVAQDRLPMFLRRLPDCARDIHFVHSDGRHVDRDRGVHAFVGEDGLHGASVIFEA